MAKQSKGGEPPAALDAVSLVELCRLLDVPVGLGVASGAEVGDDDRQLKRELLELHRAYARIGNPGIRRTLLQLVQAAADRG